MCCPDSKVSGLDGEGRIQVKTLGVGDFPGGPVVKTSPSNTGGPNSIPDQRAKIPHASWPKNQNIKQKQYCYKFNKAFKEERKKVKSLNCVQVFVTPWTVVCQAPPSIGFSRQEYWSGCHFLLQGKTLKKVYVKKKKTTKKLYCGGRRLLLLEKEYVKALQDSRDRLTTMDSVPRFSLHSRKSGIEVSWNGSG